MMDFVINFASLMVASLLAAVISLWGNHYLQHRVGRRVRDADDLKRRLYDLLDLAAKYWLSENSDEKFRLELEARIIASQSIISSELREMKRYSKELQQWYSETGSNRLDLMDAVSGGSFQQRSGWHQDPDRVSRAARAIQRIIRALNRAC